jgi:hypothetical protein
VVDDLPDAFAVLMAISDKGEGKSNSAAKETKTLHPSAQGRIATAES